MKVYFSLLLFFFFGELCAQSTRNESFNISYKSELKSIEAKLARDGNNPKFLFQYGDLTYKLCKYRESEKAFLKVAGYYKDSPEYFLKFYHTAKALKEHKKADELFYQYKALSNTRPIENNTITYKELDAENYPTIANIDLTQSDYFPYLLRSGRVKHLVKKDFKYFEPSNALLFKGYLTEEINFTDDEFAKSNLVKQPNKGEGFSYSNFCLNRDQDKIYMTRYDGVNQRMIICFSEKINEVWTQFKVFSFIDSIKSNFLHPMLTPNEEQLIFSSDMKGTLGGFDLWMADINRNNELENIQNLGTKINTFGNECYPTLYGEQGFFFSSDGHPGYGSLDIYRCDFNNNRLSEPINLGKGINSTRDDYGLFYSDKTETAFFSSNRSISHANMFFDKIYKIKINLFNRNILTFEISNPFGTKLAEQVAVVSEHSKAYSKHTSTNQNQSQETDIQNLPVQNISGEATSEELYKPRGENIQEIFTQPQTEIIETASQSNHLIESKFWTKAKLLFKEIGAPISYTYCRVINPKNEVIYSNYSTENGEINIEVVESNEYTIEIPRFKTAIKKYVFNKENNILHFDYTSTSESIATMPIKRASSNIANNTNIQEINSYKSLSTTKPKFNKNNTKTSANKNATQFRNNSIAQGTKSTTKKISLNTAKPKSKKMKSDTEKNHLPPKNILQNFN